MKRLALALPIAILALVTGPIASASANHSVLSGGTCWVEGNAEFGANLGFGPVKTTFKFKAEAGVGARQLGAKANTCEGTATEYEPGGTEVSGKKETGTFEITEAK